MMARDKAMFVFDVFWPPALNLNSIYQGLEKENIHAFNISELIYNAKIKHNTQCYMQSTTGQKFNIMNTNDFNKSYGVWPPSLLLFYGWHSSEYEKSLLAKIYFNVFAPSSSPSTDILLYYSSICYQALLIWLRRWTSDV